MQKTPIDWKKLRILAEEALLRLKKKEQRSSSFRKAGCVRLDARENDGRETNG
ncbi:hypothetical protein KAU92_00685 [Candidatus Bathyarchaeota archaeon]|nr:hypothetical protein [Candidatus Bathyarchaeota archaeon]